MKKKRARKGRSRVRASADPAAWAIAVLISISGDLPDRNLQDAEHGSVFRVLGPSYRLSPVVSIGLFLPGTCEQPEVVIRNAAKDEEKSSKDARDCCHRNVDGIGDLGRRKETICDILVCQERMEIATRRLSEELRTCQGN